MANSTHPSSKDNKDYPTILSTLKTYPPPLLPPGHSYNPNTTASIARLQLHPSLEAALHILNHDLPSAHFLVRHMEAPPAVEGMTLHAILHRIEGDYDNARAWYADVGNDADGLAVLQEAWGQEEGDAHAKKMVLRFVDEVEALNKRKEGDKTELEQKSLNEIMAVVQICEEKFGTERWEDSRDAWTRSPEKNQKMKEAMTTGGEGHRQF